MLSLSCICLTRLASLVFVFVDGDCDCAESCDVVLPVRDDVMVLMADLILSMVFVS